MNLKHIRKILKDTDFVHTGGSAEELRVAEYLKAEAEAMGASAWLEPFPVQMADIQAASLEADGEQIRCVGYKNCGSGEIEAPFLYLPSQDPVSLKSVAGKIVLIDGGLRYFGYHDLLDNGALGFITYNGNVNFPDDDIDSKELRGFVAEGRKALAVNICARDARKLVKNRTKTVKIKVEETEFEGKSRNVVAELPGTSGEWIVLTAHYDTVPLTHGAYDNMSGCIGLLEIMDRLRQSAPHRYGLRFVFCGSEERGLLGSKAYCSAHDEELKNVVLNVNLDMIGSVMGKFIACVSAEEHLVSFIKYFAGARGWGIDAHSGVYSSDSTPFADHGVPSLSFARGTPSGQGSIHCRYDTAILLSDEQLRADGDFCADFTAFMADAVVCPVSRTIPDKIKEDLDRYLNRKR
ncbi:MAG: Zn-dependent exopeptidase M28 [Ruminococcaceae bacterium]|jgi:hypothetical protein|nr:Zn-dependent exopeptidase M28 [Oscillospiraceae bacterium]